MSRRQAENVAPNQMKLALKWADESSSVQPVLQPEHQTVAQVETKNVRGQVKKDSIVYINNSRYGWKVVEDIAVERVLESQAGQLARYRVIASGKMYRDGQFRTLTVDSVVSAYAKAFRPAK